MSVCFVCKNGNGAGCLRWMKTENITIRRRCCWNLVIVVFFCVCLKNIEAFVLAGQRMNIFNNFFSLSSQLRIISRFFLLSFSVHQVVYWLRVGMNAHLSGIQLYSKPNRRFVDISFWCVNVDEFLRKFAASNLKICE